MRTEVLKWLELNNLDINKLVSKWRIKPIAIIEAADQIYDKMRGGEKIKPIKIGWRIRTIAKAIEGRRDIQEVKDLKSAHERIIELEHNLMEQEAKYIECIIRLRKEIEYLKFSTFKKIWLAISKCAWFVKHITWG